MQTAMVLDADAHDVDIDDLDAATALMDASVERWRASVLAEIARRLREETGRTE
jgi:hypothetical protein